ncbi:MAG: acetyl-CoA C-acyltransferase, partial [Spirochaetota bacterium]
LASEEAVNQYGLTPIAELVAWSQAALDPAYMGLGPVPAIRKALSKAGAKLGEMELIELNEAFAAQSLGVLRELSEEHGESTDDLLARTNVNGGAIALGHPIGASGNRITVTLLHEMIRRDAKLGLASLCIGGGMGTALIVKRGA